LERGATTADPWIEPPITPAAPPSKIQDWEFRKDPKDPNIKLTPPIPWIDGDLVRLKPK
jgi:hypothetical protein